MEDDRYAPHRPPGFEQGGPIMTVSRPGSSDLTDVPEKPVTKTMK